MGRGRGQDDSGAMRPTGRTDQHGRRHRTHVSVARNGAGLRTGRRLDEGRRPEGRHRPGRQPARSHRRRARRPARAYPRLAPRFGAGRRQIRRHPRRHHRTVRRRASGQVGRDRHTAVLDRSRRLRRRGGRPIRRHAARLLRARRRLERRMAGSHGRQRRDDASGLPRLRPRSGACRRRGAHRKRRDRLPRIPYRAGTDPRTEGPRALLRELDRGGVALHGRNPRPELPHRHAVRSAP